MLLYDVTYVGKSDLDTKVGWGYLQRLAKKKKYNGAKAVCVNGEAVCLVLRDGEWIDEDRSVE